VAPITLFGTSGRYANALYAAAAKKKALLDVEADLKLFTSTCSSNPSLMAFVTDPSISRSAKSKGISGIMESAKASETTTNLMMALAENGRLGDVFKVADGFSTILTAAKGETKAIITSAKPLPDAEVAEIVKSLQPLLEGSGSVSTEVKVDPGLINGITIEFGDKFLDMSASSQLKKLQQLLSDGL